ncbi:GSCOCG00012193001-RA-CDS [Cotesia congregata]|nr:GSCOCG00012193001-RA-CDS [Cotesia congregata]
MVVYLNCGLIGPQQDPLIWWRQEKNKYPRLSLMARRYLGIPSTSSESERLFSTAGDIVSDKRTSLSPDSVSYLLFLNKNL